MLLCTAFIQFRIKYFTFLAGVVNPVSKGQDYNSNEKQSH